MKTRCDFVTNSSSSSFILAFENEDSIKTELANENTDGHLETIYKDVMAAERYSKEKILEEYRDDIYYKTKWQVEEYFERTMHMSYKEVRELENSEMFKSMVEKELQSKIDILSKKMEGNSVFVMVEYDDHCNSELEHHIMPYLNCCMERISHH